MPKTILSVNAGSSSVKLSLYRTSKDDQLAPEALAEIQISGLTSPPPLFTYKRGGKTVKRNKKLKEDEIKSQKDAFNYMLEELLNDANFKEVSKQEDLNICHRVVHGGDYDRPCILNQETYHHIEALTDLAPLHNAPALAIIKHCIATLPSTTTNIAVFDSQFHHSIPRHIATYPINPTIASANRLRKYGFHRISYSFITGAAATFLAKPVQHTSLIALHLGSGATRSGDVDPSLVFHYAANVGKLSPSSTGDLHIARAEEILNREAGWKALASTTDFGAIAAAAAGEEEEGRWDEERKMMNLAFEIFVNRVCNYVGSYYVALGGEVDALVFAGGIGEKSALLPARVTAQLGCLGFGVDEGENNKQGSADVVWDISAKGSRHKTLVCATDEQFEIARICAEEKDMIG